MNWRRERSKKGRKEKEEREERNVGILERKNDGKKLMEVVAMV